MANELTWLGHATFRLDTSDGRRVYVDPWLDGNPSCPDQEREPDRCDLVLVTHGHDDHVGQAPELMKRFGCPAIAQVELRGFLAERSQTPFDITQAANKGGTVTIDGLSVTLTDANHSSSHDGTYLGEPCGLVVRTADGLRIYFAGDTNVFGDMALIARLYQPDVAVLPIGDHFTMGPEEAAVAIELLGVGRVVPCHYGTFPLLTGTPERLRELVPADIEVVAPAAGETITL